MRPEENQFDLHERAKECGIQERTKMKEDWVWGLTSPTRHHSMANVRHLDQCRESIRGSLYTPKGQCRAAGSFASGG